MRAMLLCATPEGGMVSSVRYMERENGIEPWMRDSWRREGVERLEQRETEKDPNRNEE